MDEYCASQVRSTTAFPRFSALDLNAPKPSKGLFSKPDCVVEAEALDNPNCRDAFLKHN